jgi:alcohol dehydrogenase class IV
VELIVIPSIWGSGAEVSPIAVRNRDGKKEIRMDPKLLPDARLVWPELAAAIPPDRVRVACGDCWAHALEGFLSPLATQALRAELASLLAQMLATPINNDPVWFELGARACAGQARSSVGLVHGIAHTLEGVLRARHPGADWGHAKLCSLFLWPVMRFNEQASGKWQQLLAEHGLPPRAILEVLRTLFDAEAYEQALPVLKEQWLSVLRDPCSRTNSALVRPASLDFFARQQFL